jgi:hypothetical protein
MILRLFCFLTVIFSLPIIAQEPISTATVDLKFSELSKSHKKSFLKGVFLEKDGHYFGVRSVGSINLRSSDAYEKFERFGSHIVLEEYDSNFQLIRESDDFWVGWRYYNPRMLGLTTNESGDLLVILEGRQGKENYITAAMVKVNPVTFEVEKESEKQKVVEIVDPKAEGYGLGSFQFITSKNGNYQALIYDYSEKSTKQIIEAYVFDRNWNLKYSRIDKMPIKSELAELISCSVSDEGETHLLLKQYKNKLQEIARDKANYEIVLRSFVDADSKVSVQSIDLNDNIVQAINMAEAPNGDIVIGANIGAIGSESPERLLCARLSSLKDTIYPLSFVVVPADTIAKDLKVGSYIEKGFEAPDIYFGNEGGVYLVSERVDLTKTALGMFESENEITYYARYVGLFIGYFNPAGNTWFDYVSKYQLSRNDLGRYSSFAALTKEEELHLFYMSHNYASYFSKDERRNMTHTSFNSSHERKTETLFSGKDLKIITCPRFAYTDANNRLVIPFVSGRKSALMVIEFKD